MKKQKSAIEGIKKSKTSGTWKPILKVPPKRYLFVVFQHFA